MRTLVLRLEVGERFVVSDLFPEAEIVSVKMKGSSWRLAELSAATPFTVGLQDCRHRGNWARGQDRIEVVWRGLDGQTETDMLDLCYCEPELELAA